MVDLGNLTDKVTPNKNNTQTGDEVKGITDVIEHPSVVIVTGERGSGKSYFGYRACELISAYEGIKPCVMGFPENKKDILPNNFKVITRHKEAPNGSVVMIDEAYREFHARDYDDNDAVDMSELINLSRQHNRTILFITQESRQLDINAVSQTDYIVMKRPALLQQEFERKELAKRTREAEEKLFDKLPNEDKYKKYSYVFSRNYKGVMTNKKPSFACKKLTTAYGE